MEDEVNESMQKRRLEETDRRNEGCGWGKVSATILKKEILLDSSCCLHYMIETTFESMESCVYNIKLYSENLNTW